MKSIRDNYVGPDWAPSGTTKVVVVGEAPGTDEALQGKPFVGVSGRLLRHAMEDAGFDMSSVTFTNVFRHKPPQTSKKTNDASIFFMKKREYKEYCKRTDFKSPFPIKGTDGYLRPEHHKELLSLYEEIIKADPDIVICMGAFAMWALTGEDRIGKFRGTITEVPLQDRTVKVIATYHPANVLRNWNNRYNFDSDLNKALREVGSQGIERTSREIWVEPDLEDIVKFTQELEKGNPIAVDIETDAHLKQITCVGIADSRHRALVIPFVDRTKRNNSYWTTIHDECMAWNYIEAVLQDRDIPKIFQNGTYDIFWFMFQMGIPVRGLIHDTMHMHHAMQPELPKGLDSLAANYINETAWKTLVTHTKENKRDA